MKMTKEITIKNMFNEVVTIEPIPYETALKVIELQEESYNLVDSIGKLFIKLYDAGEENLKENMEIKNMMEQDGNLDQEEKAIRENFNYWYVGLDNLDIEDKNILIEKYPRRKK